MYYERNSYLCSQVQRITPQDIPSDLLEPVHSDKRLIPGHLMDRQLSLDEFRHRFRRQRKVRHYAPPSEEQPDNGSETICDIDQLGPVEVFSSRKDFDHIIIPVG